MLIPGQRVADEDRVRTHDVKLTVSLIGDRDRRQRAAAVERERRGERDCPVEAETIVHRRPIRGARTGLPSGA